MKRKLFGALFILFFVFLVVLRNTVHLEQPEKLLPENVQAYLLHSEIRNTLQMFHARIRQQKQPVDLKQIRTAAADFIAEIRQKPFSVWRDSLKNSKKSTLAFLKKKQQIWISLYSRTMTPGQRLPLWIQKQGKTAPGKMQLLGGTVEMILRDPAFHRLFLKDPRSVQKILNGTVIKIDILAGETCLPQQPQLLRNISVIAGLDGVSLIQNKRRRDLLPDELIGFGIRELNLQGSHYGLNFNQLFQAFALKHRGSRINFRQAFTLRRFRTFSFIEDPETKKPLEIYRANILTGTNRPPTRQELETGLRAALRNLALHVTPNGSFNYLYYPTENRIINAGYSWARHAGAVWMLYRGAHYLNKNRNLSGTGDPEVRFIVDAAERATDRMKKALGLNIPRVTSGNSRPGLYALAIATLTLLERKATLPAAEDDKLLQALGGLLLRHQDSNGMFHYNPVAPKTRVSPKKSLPYAPGETMLALGRIHRLWPQPAYKTAVEKGLDFIINRVWSFFTGRVFWGFYSWEMQAIEDNSGWFKSKPGITRFCFDQADALLRYQYTETANPTRDYLGGFQQTMFNFPKSAQVGARGEGILAAMRLARKTGDHERFKFYRDRLLLAARFILNHQVRTENSWYYRNPEKALGAIRYTPVFHELRIDHTQHCAAVLLDLLRELPPETR